MKIIILLAGLLALSNCMPTTNHVNEEEARFIWNILKPVINLIPEVGHHITDAIDQSGIGAAIDSALNEAAIAAIGKRELNEVESRFIWTLIKPIINQIPEVGTTITSLIDESGMGNVIDGTAVGVAIGAVGKRDLTQEEARFIWNILKPVINLIPEVGHHITDAIDQSGIGAAIDSALNEAAIAAIGKRELTQEEARFIWNLLKPIINQIPEVGNLITDAIDQSGIGSAIDSVISGAAIAAIGKRDLTDEEARFIWNLLKPIINQIPEVGNLITSTIDNAGIGAAIDSASLAAAIAAIGK